MPKIFTLDLTAVVSHRVGLTEMEARSTGVPENRPIVFSLRSREATAGSNCDDYSLCRIY